MLLVKIKRNNVVFESEMSTADLATLIDELGANGNEISVLLSSSVSEVVRSHDSPCRTQSGLRPVAEVRCACSLTEILNATMPRRAPLSPNAAHHKKKTP
jgi:hypothetical protein